jgi:hypothetical protein
MRFSTCKLGSHICYVKLRFQIRPQLAAHDPQLNRANNEKRPHGRFRRERKQVCYLR